MEIHAKCNFTDSQHVDNLQKLIMYVSMMLLYMHSKQDAIQVRVMITCVVIYMIPMNKA